MTSPEEKPKLAWYYRSWMIVTAFLCVGPLALPLIWQHPQMSRLNKWIVTILVLVITYFLTVAVIETMKLAWYYIKQLLLVLEPI